jgi:ankyrin repeat protein
LSCLVSFYEKENVNDILWSSASLEAKRIKIARHCVSRRSQRENSTVEALSIMDPQIRDGGLPDGIDIEIAGTSGAAASETSSETPHSAAVRENMDVINVNTRDDSGHTALHLAAKEGHVKMVKDLLAQGADVHAKDNVSL